MQKKAVILLSGGVDSATCLAMAKAEGYDVYALTIYYKQRHDVELKAARALAERYDVARHVQVDIDLRVFGGSALTDDVEVPKHGRVEEIPTEIPVTYVPARNTIFLSYALAWAESIGSTDIFIGVNALDYSGYPDCRPDFIKAFERMANLATKAGIEGSVIRIHTPLLMLTKGEIIQRGSALGLDYGMTHSCYDPAPDEAACGHCDSCLLRQKGFIEAGVPDPTRYASAS